MSSKDKFTPEPWQLLHSLTRLFTPVHSREQMQANWQEAAVLIDPSLDGEGDPTLPTNMFYLLQKLAVLLGRHYDTIAARDSGWAEAAELIGEYDAAQPERATEPRIPETVDELVELVFLDLCPAHEPSETDKITNRKWAKARIEGFIAARCDLIETAVKTAVGVLFPAPKSK